MYLEKELKDETLVLDDANEKVLASELDLESLGEKEVFRDAGKESRLWLISRILCDRANKDCSRSRRFPLIILIFCFSELFKAVIKTPKCFSTQVFFAMVRFLVSL